MLKFKSFITTFTTLAYLIISLFSIGNDVLCIHQSGSSSFEAMGKNGCIDANESQNKQTTNHYEHEIIQSTGHVDPCFDISLAKDSFSSVVNPVPEKDLQLKIISLVKYLSYLDDTIPNSNTFNSRHQTYFSQVEKQNIAIYSFISNKKTISLLI